ncbi:hypothetical protein I2I05_15780 [Hymenobacter sp. BT683]|uniref:GWxTD domain-containing protein n=1 Tax=Hymenobacter jeongseonensis TaxID=2791027 RepID=A0ABS0IKF8_9BACT|nr:hypothetical protein [Hymenobacter jeongseonensis]MBF9238863.1 hypothetical protein [Hymenobacter jeongseonensis]
MPPLSAQPPVSHFCLLLFGLALATTSCARRDFFQPDARIGVGSSEPLPPATDSVLTVAGRQYNRYSKFYQFFWGHHYRPVWAAPAKVQVLQLATAAPGGLKAGKPGGGFQSISMTMEGTKEREYALRALDKNPVKTLPKFLQNSFLLNTVRDATSAAMPYGALTVPPFAQAAGVPHTRPRLVYVRQDETGLGEMSERFQGKVALLEEKYDALASRTADLAGATDFKGGESVLEQVYANPAHTIDEPAFLRARLLDVWLGDWDRHEGQWDWAEFKKPDGRVRYQAIPKDRDQVYFRFDDGIIPWFVSRRFILPRFQTFKPNYGNVAGLVQQGDFIDQRGLKQMTRTDFSRTAADLQRRLPDSLIERALRRLPPAVYALEGPTLRSALKARRETLPQAAETFYLTLARKPVVGGTAQAERFVVQRYPDSTTVRVFSTAPNKVARRDSLQFRRTYFNAETRELSLEGLSGNDVFELETIGAGRPIALLVYGGAGQDILRLKGSGNRLKLYDETSDLTAAQAPRPQPPKKKRLPYDRTLDTKGR